MKSALWSILGDLRVFYPPRSDRGGPVSLQRRTIWAWVGCFASPGLRAPLSRGRPGGWGRWGANPHRPPNSYFLPPFCVFLALGLWVGGASSAASGGVS